MKLLFTKKGPQTPIVFMLQNILIFLDAIITKNPQALIVFASEYSDSFRQYQVSQNPDTSA